MSFNTKLFFDEELNKSFLEGGDGDATPVTTSKRSLSGSKRGGLGSKSSKNKAVPLPDDEQEGFIRKTYGLFSAAVLTQLIWVIVVVSQPDDSGLKKFCKNIGALIGFLAMAVIATGLVICKKSAKEPIPTGMGYACWFLQTIGLAFCVGFLAAKKGGDKANMVLVAEIATMLIAVVCTFFGGKLLKMTGTDKKMKAMGSTFMILGIVLTTVFIASSLLQIGGMSSKLLLSLVLVLACGFFIADTQFIINGKYG